MLTTHIDRIRQRCAVKSMLPENRNAVEAPRELHCRRQSVKLLHFQLAFYIVYIETRSPEDNTVTTALHSVRQSRTLSQFVSATTDVTAHISLTKYRPARFVVCIIDPITVFECTSRLVRKMVDWHLQFGCQKVMRQPAIGPRHTSMKRGSFTTVPPASDRTT